MDRGFHVLSLTFRRNSLSVLTLCLACALGASRADAQGRFGFGDGGGDGGSRGFRRDRGGFGPAGGGFGGPGGFSPEDFFNRLDQNGDGQLDEDEIGDGGVRRMLEFQGIDPSGGISLDDFMRAREQRDQGFGDGGFRGYRGRGDDRGRGDQSDSRDREKEKKPRPRVTFDLPSSYLPADMDGDGQVAMYEWRHWRGHSLGEFLAMDRNGDGFLTPREIVSVAGAAPDSGAVSTTPIAGTTLTGQPASSLPTATPPVSTPSVAGSSDPVTADANRFFERLDVDENGVIAGDEWQKSIRIRGMFEGDGIDLSQPMSAETFLQNYVRLESAGG